MPLLQQVYAPFHRLTQLARTMHIVEFIKDHGGIVDDVDELDVSDLLDPTLRPRTLPLVADALVFEKKLRSSAFHGIIAPPWTNLSVVPVKSDMVYVPIPSGKHVSACNLTCTGGVVGQEDDDPESQEWRPLAGATLSCFPASNKQYQRSSTCNVVVELHGGSDEGKVKMPLAAQETVLGKRVFLEYGPLAVTSSCGNSTSSIENAVVLLMPQIGTARLGLISRILECQDNGAVAVLVVSSAAAKITVLMSETTDAANVVLPVLKIVTDEIPEVLAFMNGTTERIMVDVVCGFPLPRNGESKAGNLTSPQMAEEFVVSDAVSLSIWPLSREKCGSVTTPYYIRGYTERLVRVIGGVDFSAARTFTRVYTDEAARAAQYVNRQTSGAGQFSLFGRTVSFGPSYINVLQTLYDFAARSWSWLTATGRAARSYFPFTGSSDAPSSGGSNSGNGFGGGGGDDDDGPGFKRGATYPKDPNKLKHSTDRHNERPSEADTIRTTTSKPIDVKVHNGYNIRYYTQVIKGRTIEVHTNQKLGLNEPEEIGTTFFKNNP